MIKSFEDYERIQAQIVNGQAGYIWHHGQQALLIKDVRVTRQDIINEFQADFEGSPSRKELSFASGLFAR
jgi:hypothetical protein